MTKKCDKNSTSLSALKTAIIKGGLTGCPGLEGILSARIPSGEKIKIWIPLDLNPFRLESLQI